MPKQSAEFEVEISKLVHGGQGLGSLPDGKKALVWNVLPGEKVKFVQTKSKSSFVEGIATEIIQPSPERVVPRDQLYLSTSPWQMMNYEAENKYKKVILDETLKRADVTLGSQTDFKFPENMWNYRNKMEYSFFGDEQGLHLALYNRGTHRKQVVDGSSLARPEIDEAAGKIVAELAKNSIRAGDLKSLMLRCDRTGNVVAALFTKDRKFKKIESLGSVCAGVAVYFSNPKSPASLPTELIAKYGDIELTDSLLGVNLRYDVLSFFQVNLDAYESALRDIREVADGKDVTDMYSGVGSIGLTVGASVLTLVEADRYSIAMAKRNSVSGAAEEIEVVHSTSETALEQIKRGPGSVTVFDPPRAGLHVKVVYAVLEALPQTIVYLSCNPSTFARDLKLLEKSYNIRKITGYNFFPRTPHIEALAILEKS